MTATARSPPDSTDLSSWCPRLPGSPEESRGIPTATAGPIRIGISLSFSGDFSDAGKAAKRGYQLWQSVVNAHGGLLGRQVQLKIVDDTSSPDQVVTNYQKLISSDHVDLAFGPFSTLLTVPSSKVANRFGYALIEGAGGAPAARSSGVPANVVRSTRNPHAQPARTPPR